MDFLVRKINRAKWEQRDILNGDEASADAITSCLRTLNNSLSTWLVSEDDVHDGVIAILTNQSSFDSFDLAIYPFENIDGSGIEIKKTPGNTAYDKMINNHFDLIDLTYSTLGVISKFTIELFKVNRVKRYTRGELKNLLNKALKDGVVEMEKINVNLKKDLNI